MKAVLKFRADLGRDLVAPQEGIMKKVNYAKMYAGLALKAEKNFEPKKAKKYRLLSLAYAKLGKQARTGGAKKLKPSRLFFYFLANRYMRVSVLRDVTQIFST